MMSMTKRKSPTVLESLSCPYIFLGDRDIPLCFSRKKIFLTWHKAIGKKKEKSSWDKKNKPKHITQYLGIKMVQNEVALLFRISIIIWKEAYKKKQITLAQTSRYRI